MDDGDLALQAHEIGDDLWLVDADEEGERQRWLRSDCYVDKEACR